MLQVVNVRLPTEQGRLRGFGYVEFEDKQSLIDALGLNDEVRYYSRSDLCFKIDFKVCAIWIWYIKLIKRKKKTVDCKHAKCAWFLVFKHKKGTDFVFKKSWFENAVSWLLYF